MDSLHLSVILHSRLQGNAGNLAKSLKNTLDLLSRLALQDHCVNQIDRLQDLAAEILQQLDQLTNERDELFVRLDSLLQDYLALRRQFGAVEEELELEMKRYHHTGRMSRR